MSAAQAVARAVERDNVRSRNQDGQEIGAKGQRTRARLLDATETLLATRPVHDLRVAEIAALAGASPATFYLYFGDAQKAALAVITSHVQSTPELVAMMSADWPATRMLQKAEELVRAYVAVWQSQAAIFRARNIAADEGDVRFTAARAESVRPLLDALARKVSGAQGMGGIPASLPPASVAGVLLTMLERVSAIVADRPDIYAGNSHEGMISATAFAIASVFGCGQVEAARHA